MNRSYSGHFGIALLASEKSAVKILVKRGTHIESHISKRLIFWFYILNQHVNEPTCRSSGILCAPGHRYICVRLMLKARISKLFSWVFRFLCRNRKCNQNTWSCRQHNEGLKLHSNFPAGQVSPVWHSPEIWIFFGFSRENKARKWEKYHPVIP